MRLVGRSVAARVAGASVMVLSAAVLWLLIGGGGSPARATTADDDVVLGAGVASSCTPGVDANCQSHETDIVASETGAVGGLSAHGIGGAFGLEGLSDF